MRNKESFRMLLASIHRCRNLQVVKMTIERNLSDQTLSDEQRSDLQHLFQLSTIDVIHVFTAEKLGLVGDAARLREALRRRAAGNDLRKAA